MKKIQSKLFWLAGLALGYWLLITLIIEQRNNPPELARLSNLYIEYYSTDGYWVNSSNIPTTARRLQLCGVMEKSKKATLQIRISEPGDINTFMNQNEYFFDLSPGKFCIHFSLTINEIPPGTYVLWILDARNIVSQINIIFFDE
jgi:hypothetical protein